MGEPVIAAAENLWVVPSQDYLEQRLQPECQKPCKSPRASPSGKGESWVTFTDNKTNC